MGHFFAINAQSLEPVQPIPGLGIHMTLVSFDRAQLHLFFGPTRLNFGLADKKIFDFESKDKWIFDKLKMLCTSYRPLIPKKKLCQSYFFSKTN